MNNQTRNRLTCAAVAGLACSLAHAQLLYPEDEGSEGSDPYAVGIQNEIEKQLFDMLPDSHQAAILHASPSELCTRLPDDATQDDVTYENVAGYVSRQTFDEMTPLHRFMLAQAVRGAIDGRPPVAMCFEEGSVSDEEAWAFSLALFGDNARYQQTTRWSSTVLSGGGLHQGDPTTLTYSFVPDGTHCPNIIGVTGNSQLHAWLDSRYGSQANWQPIFEAIFDRWSELTGLTYVYEPNDDGVTLNSNPGVLGVRGDVRIAAIHIDGNSGVLAYNNFPQDGDMVLDAYDSFFNTTGSNSLRLRNVAAHEHGHGIGMLHVCPANGTKLMEPFVSTSYDGPRIDDIQNGQRHYGDPFETNDTIGTATALGDLGFGATYPYLSIDDDSDVDYYSVVVPSPKQIIVSVNPNAGAYQQGTQTSSCSSGAMTDYDVIQDLSIDLIDSDGSTVLQTANDTTFGSGEILQTVIIDPGTYYLRVSGSGANALQLYSMGITLTSPDPIVIDAPEAPPGLIAPGSPVAFDVRITEITQSLDSASLQFRADDGAWQSFDLTNLGDDMYEATIPALACGDTPEFYIEAHGSGGYTTTLPSDGASGPFTAIVGEQVVAFYDDAETDMGWTVSGNATHGQWNRGVPAGAGDRGDPTTDGDNSGAAWLTDNAAGDSDVDGGSTMLTSPTLDGSDPESIVSYWHWLSNDTGAAAGQDPLTVEISNNNGASWTTLEIVGPDGAEASGGWYHSSFRVADFLTPTAQLRLRFTATDGGAGSVVEAGVDGVEIMAFSCTDAGCAADFNNDGEVNFFDVQSFLSAFAAQDEAADFNHDSVFNFFDVQAFLDAVANGCP